MRTLALYGDIFDSITVKARPGLSLDVSKCDQGLAYQFPNLPRFSSFLVYVLLRISFVQVL